MKITDLNVGMVVRITHPDYVDEFPDLQRISYLSSSKERGDNIGLIDCDGCETDGWDADDFVVVS